jgi:hypothetical protein
MIYSLTHAFKELTTKLNAINIGDHATLAFIQDTTTRIQQINTFISQTSLFVGDVTLRLGHAESNLTDLTTSVGQLTEAIESLTATLSHDQENGRTDITNTERIKLSTMQTTPSNITFGTEIQMTSSQIHVQTSEDNVIHGAIALSGGVIDADHPHGNGGVSIESDNYIHTTLRNLNHFVNINHDKVSISDVNGLVIEPDGTSGVKIRDYANTYIAHIPWE